MNAAEVIERWRRRRRGPLQRRGLPRILRCDRTLETAIDQVVKEDELGRSRKQCGVGDELVYRDERHQKIIGERRVTAYIPRQSQIVERHEDAIRTNER